MVIPLVYLQLMSLLTSADQPTTHIKHAGLPRMVDFMLPEALAEADILVHGFCIPGMSGT
jgi:hypothetical protein